MGNLSGWRVGGRLGAALLAGVCGASCEGETREYVPPNTAGAAGSGAAGLPTMSALPGDSAVGERDPSGGESMTDIRRLQPGATDSSGAESQANTGCVEGSSESCGPPREEGICKFGTRICTGGQWGECAGAVFAKQRDCSSTVDNDCDGQPDDTADDVCRCPIGGSQACDDHAGLDGKGPCKAGKQLCTLAVGNASSDWGPCEGSVGPADADSCIVSGDDANCDGVPNGGCACVEGTTIPCGPETDNGVCQRGTSTCRGGRFGECEGVVFAGTRDCSSPLDNDCNGLPDNTMDGVCTCVIGTTQPCAAHPDRDGNGPCRAGTQTCEGSAQNVASRFGACSGAVGPAQRDLCTAAGDDSDCNGTRNGGCQCIAGASNAPCSGDANNSRCSAQGTCVPCQVNADCSLVSGGRTSCNGGTCVVPVPVVTVQRFAWTSQQGPVDMGLTQGRACLLTGVGGKFNRMGDVVQIVSQAGHWLLTGSVDPAGSNNFVEARAACVAASTVTNEVSIQALPSARAGVDLESLTTHACFLTRIAGNFRTGSENVQLGTATGVWRLSGSAQQTDGVSVSARCMPMQPVSESFLLAFGATSPLPLEPTLNGLCYLARASGEFEAEGDLVETEWSGTAWQLQRSAGSALQAAAVCFGRNQGGVPALQ